MPGREAVRGGLVTPRSCGMIDLSPEALAEALDQGGLTAWYQPRISCSSRALVGFEALPRWLHPEFGMIMPDQFMPLAHRSGLLGRLARQVIEDALAWFARHFRDTSITLAMNLSSGFFMDPDLPAWLMQCCSRFAIAPGQLILGIPETDAMADHDKIDSVAMRLRIQGFLFGISNFGLGNASLRLLAQLPFSELELDRRFAAQAPASETSREIIANLVVLARAVDLHVTADGVEDGWTLEFLERARCHAAQGPLIAPPMDGPTTLSWRRSHEHGPLRPRR
jgi:EAL domain-containing protein (putative c-di-GMP-specific phosphodiesterase class I)